MKWTSSRERGRARLASDQVDNACTGLDGSDVAAARQRRWHDDLLHRQRRRVDDRDLAVSAMRDERVAAIRRNTYEPRLPAGRRLASNRAVTQRLELDGAKSPSKNNWPVLVV